MRKLFKVEWNTEESGLQLKAQIGRPVSSWSTRNLVAFTTGHLESKQEKSWLSTIMVHIMNPEYPWEVYHIETGLKEPVEHLMWDRSGTRLLVIDGSGACRVFAMRKYMVNNWECTHEADVGNKVVCAAWLDAGVKNVFDAKAGPFNLLEKFPKRFGKSPLIDISGLSREGFILVTETGFAHCGVLESGEKEVQLQKTKLFASRCRVLRGDICFKDDGKVQIVLATNQRVVEYFVLVLKIVTSKVEILVEISPCIVPHKMSDEEYMTYQISCVRFSNEANMEKIIICTETAGVTTLKHFESKVEKASLQPVLQRMTQNPKVFPVKEWSSSKSVTVQGNVSCLALSRLSSVAQPVGGDLPIYPAMIIATDEGTLQKLPLNLSGPNKTTEYFQEESILCLTCSPSDTCILAVTDKGNIVVYQVSSFENTTETVAIKTCVNLFEYCLVTGHSSWDVTIACAAFGDRFTEQCNQFLRGNLKNQPAMTQERISRQYAQMQADIFKSLDGVYFGSLESFNVLMLKSIYTYLHAVVMVKSSDREAQILTKIKMICNGQVEIDLPKIMQLLDINNFMVNSSLVASVQNLIQWVASYSIHICKLVLSSDRGTTTKQPLSVLNIQGLKTLQEIITLIYVWGQKLPGWQPHFLELATPLDILNQVFELVSKLCMKFAQGDYTKDNINDEEIPMRSHPMMYKSLPLYDPKCGIISQCRFQTKDFDIYEFTSEEETISSARNYSFPHPLTEQVEMYSNSNGEFFFDGMNLMTSSLMKDETLKQCLQCSCVTLSIVNPGRVLQSSLKDQWSDTCFCGGFWRGLDIVKESSDHIKSESVSPDKK